MANMRAMATLLLLATRPLLCCSRAHDAKTSTNDVPEEFAGVFPLLLFRLDGLYQYTTAIGYTIDNSGEHRL